LDLIDAEIKRRMEDEHIWKIIEYTVRTQSS
jgi:hypothetical protein